MACPFCAKGWGGALRWAGLGSVGTDCSELGRSGAKARTDWWLLSAQRKSCPDTKRCCGGDEGLPSHISSRYGAPIVVPRMQWE